ncbi:MAG: hypothetical protein ACK5L3_09060 [Oscillospiraceae bacterium]
MKFFGKKTTGYTNKTGERLLLDAGVFFKNYDAATDTFESAVSAGKVLGATRGGGEFKAAPKIRRLEIDGLPENSKDNIVIDNWEVTMGATLLEVTPENLALSLAAATQTDGPTGYYTIKGKGYVEETDYIANVTFVGRLSGSNSPVIIQVFNAINTEGLTLTTQANNEGTIKLTLAGNYDAATDLDIPPFAIHYPKPATAPTGGGTE